MNGQPSGPPSTLRQQLVIVAGAATLFHLLLQWTAPALVEFDAYYHVGLAQLYSERGLVRSFPWMRLSVLAERFNDPQLLLHLLLWPLCKLGVDPIVAGKIVCVVAAVSFLVALHAFLHRRGVAHPGAFTLMAGLGSPYLIARLTFLKSTGLFLAEVLFFLDALFLPPGRSARARLLAISWLAVYTYQGYPLLLVIALLWIGALALLGQLERWDWRSLGAIAGGLAAGLVLNPFFPHDLAFFNFEILEQLLFRPSEVALGAEWGSIDSAMFLSTTAFALLALFVAGLLAQHTRAVLTPERLLLSALAGLVFLGAMASSRLIDYFIPLAIITAALAIQATLEATLPEARRTLTAILLGVALVVGVPAAGLHLRGALRIIKSVAAALRVDAYRVIAARLAAASPEGELVVAQWDDFPLLFLWNRHNHYAFGLNPMYGYGYSAPMYTAHQLLYEGRLRDPESLMARLGAKLLVVSRTADYPGRRALLLSLQQNPAFEELAHEGDLFVFRLR